MKKGLILTLLLLCISVLVYACPVCDKQQPKVLQGISHGAGPDGNLDYAIVWLAVGIVLLSLFYTIKWMIRPGEKNNNHIKNTILN